MVTGEPIPVEKGPGDKLIGGTVNGTGGRRDDGPSASALRPCSPRSCAWSARPSAAAPRSSGWPTSSPSYFVPAVLLVAVLTFVVWAIFGPEPRLAYALVNAVAVLIIACPCALRACDPDVDHGRHGSRGHGRRAHQERRGARGAGESRHAGGRQDGDPHRGEAPRRLRRRRRGQDETELLRLAASLERGERASARGGRRHCGQGAGTDALRVERISGPSRARASGHRRRPDRRDRQSEAPRRLGDRPRRS